MPRSGWLAIGVVGGALVAPPIGPAAPIVLSALALMAAAIMGIAWSSGTRSMPRRSIPTAALGLGFLALRLAIHPASAVEVGTPSGAGPWQMVVESVGSPRDGDQTAMLRTEVEGTDGFRLAATLPRYPEIEPGDVVVTSGRVRPRPDGAYGDYLARLGAWGSLDARNLEVVGREGGPLGDLEQLRRRAGDALTIALPEPEAGLAAGILIGLRDRVDRSVAADFTTAGVSHVVAISGWNIAIVAAAVAATAGRFARRRRAILTVIAVVAYVAFAGASPSVLRAGVMAGVVLLARESGRAGHAAGALGWAAALLVIASPAMASDAGFQLSTLATAGLIAWATPLTAWLDGHSRGRLPGWLAESLGVSLAAQAATLPLVLVAFGRLSIIAPLINLLVVPLVVPAMAAGIAALIASILVVAGAPMFLATVVAAPAWVALRLMIAIVSTGARLPFAAVTLEPAPAAIAAAVSMTLGLAVLAWFRWDGRLGVVAWLTSSVSVMRGSSGVTSRGRTSVGDPVGTPGRKTSARPSRWLRAASVALVVSVAVTGGVIAARPSAVVTITVLDVGQGDAILIEGSRGGRLLIDGGPDPDRLLVVLDRHLPPWDRRIDVVILSHPHEDHVAGLALLLDRYRVGRVFEPGMRGPGPGYAAWAERLGRPGAPVRLGLATGDRLSVDDVAMRVLWPDRGKVPSEPPDTGTGINNVSIVLLGEVDGRRFLLTGDIEQGVDPVVLARGVPRVDLLKIAHHGSRTATTQAFVDATRPAIAIASAGTGNPYGHPTRATLDRLREAGSRVYRTDRDGSVTVRFGVAGLSVRTEPRPGADIARPTDEAPRSNLPPLRSFACSIPATYGVRSTREGAVRPAADSDSPGRANGSERPGRWTRQDGADRSDATLGYHRLDAQSSRQTTDRPSPLCLGRRRPPGRARHRPIRGCPRRRDGRTARALARPWRADERRVDHRRHRRATRHTHDVRWRDARHRVASGSARSTQRDS